jgi:hypothetical protein
MRSTLYGSEAYTTPARLLGQAARLLNLIAEGVSLLDGAKLCEASF